MTSKPPARDAWDRFAPVWHGVLYVALAVVTAVVVAGAQVGLAERVELLIAAAAVGALYHAVIVRHPNSERASLRPMAFLVPAISVFAWASSVHPVYLTLVGLLTGHAFAFLPFRWAVPHVLAIAAIIAWRNAEYLGPFGIGAALVAVAMSVLLSLYIHAIVRQSLERKRLIEELEAARGELARAERAAGTLAERERLSGELHDTVTQDLVSIVRLLESADGALASSDRDRAVRDVAKARAAARDALDQARRLVWSMRPDLLEKERLAGALRRTVGSFERETGVAAKFVVEPAEVALPPELEVALLRSAQEALANVKKHASARSVAVTLTLLEGRALLDVHDDGVGFNAASASASEAGGFGLALMKERVAKLDGVVTIESARDEGTTVAVELPVPGEAP